MPNYEDSDSKQSTKALVLNEYNQLKNLSSYVNATISKLKLQYPGIDCRSKYTKDTIDAAGRALEKLFKQLAKTQLTELIIICLRAAGRDNESPIITFNADLISVLSEQCLVGQKQPLSKLHISTYFQSNDDIVALLDGVGKNKSIIDFLLGLRGRVFIPYFSQLLLACLTENRRIKHFALNSWYGVSKPEESDPKCSLYNERYTTLSKCIDIDETINFIWGLINLNRLQT